MTNRIIHPRVGSNYSTAGLRNQRIMIVGESSYDKDAKREGYDIANQTINVGADAIGYDGGRGYWNDSRFYTRIARMFEFNPRSFAHRKEFWDSVVYYNFLQIVLTKPRQNPPSDSWTEARGAFLETIEEFKPEIILSFSKRMWPHLPKLDDSGIPNDFGVQCREARISTPGGHNARLIGFDHPTSYGFRWKPVCKVIHQLIPRAELLATGQPAISIPNS